MNVSQIRAPYLISRPELSFLLIHVLFCTAVLLYFREMIAKHEVCIRVLGNLELLPPDIQQLIAEAVSFSRDNTKLV